MKDRKGNELNVGDIVLVPCVVKNIDENKEHWNNVVLVTQETNYPGQYNTELHLNALQIERSADQKKDTQAAIENAIIAEAEEDEQRVMDSEPTWPSVGDATRKKRTESGPGK
jgi:hypothetical protein